MKEKWINFLEIIKILIDKFKSAWKVPRKRAGIKLLGYFIFLLIFFILAIIGNNSNNERKYDKKETKNTTEIKENLTAKQKKFLDNNHQISYEITTPSNTYKINGTLKESIIEGYLETTDTIKKITIKDNSIYEYKNNELVLLEIEFDTSYLNVTNIFNLIEKNRAFIKEEDNNKIYQYSLSINDITANINLITDKNKINEIDVNYNNIIYNLNFDK